MARSVEEFGFSSDRSFIVELSIAAEVFGGGRSNEGSVKEIEWSELCTFEARDATEIGSR